MNPYRNQNSNIQNQNYQYNSNINKNPQMSNYMQNNPNNSQYQSPSQSQQFPQKKQNPSLGYYTIFETRDNVYIKHQKSSKVISMDRNFQKIYEVSDYNEVLNMKYVTNFLADSILGILNINKLNKYLIVVTSSKIAAKFKGSYIYNILKVRLVKITFFQETEEEQKCVKEINGLFSTRNFYYSNDYDLSLSLSMQEKNVQNSEYLINSSLLIPFQNFRVPKIFYSHVIFGYVGCKIDVDIKDLTNGTNRSVDLIIIERVYKKSLLVNDDIPQQLKQIEFITVYKNGENEKNIFFFIIYFSNELFYQNIKGIFNPYNDNIKEEINKYKKVICIINDIYIIQNNSITDFIHSNDELRNLIELTNLTSKWKKNLFFESNENCDTYITSYLSNSKIEQEKVFWFIDINNNMINPKYCNDICLNAIVRIIWIAIQKQTNKLGWNTNIGLFHSQNNKNISVKYRDVVIPYYNDRTATKKYLYNPKIRNLIQVVYDFCFNGKFYNSKNMFLDDKNNIFVIDYSANSSFNKNKSIYNFALNNETGVNYDKLSILCITWNVNNLSIEDNNLDITNLFTENILYQNKTIPDIIFIGLQEIIELSGPPEELCKKDTTQKVLQWTEKISKYIENIYNNSVYIPVKVLDLVGIYFICFIKYELQTKLNLVDFNITKTGFDGKYGNKGFITMTLKYDDSYISVSNVHFEAGEEKNEKRLENLKQLLNNSINLEENRKVNFKNVDYWIILGDTNFRIEMDYNNVIDNIEKNNLNYLLKNDQFYKNKNSENDFNLINEENIKFNPTYKFIKGRNCYDNNQNKLRTPSWTDRIFFVKKNGIKNVMYNSINSLFLSDHKPVVGVFEIFCKNSQIKILENPYLNVK